MIFQVTDMEHDARVAMDEDIRGGVLETEGDSTTLELNAIIRSKIEEAVRITELAAPYYLLETGHNFGDELFWNEKKDGSGWVLLPTDFARLMVFRMSDWERAVTEAVTVDSIIYQRQSSRYKGIRGNTQKPICAIVQRPEGKALEFYSSKDDKAKVATALYLPVKSIDEDGGIDISERCYRSVVYAVAALTLETLGETQRAERMMGISKSLLA